MTSSIRTGQVRQQHRDLRTVEDLLDAIETLHDWLVRPGTGVSH
ncbi:hypothetical protein AB0D04_02445 [Streptomyces sp. NPDC048483]